MNQHDSPETFHRRARIFLVSLGLGIGLNVVANAVGGLAARLAAEVPSWGSMRAGLQFLAVAGHLSFLVAAMWSFMTAFSGVMRWKSLAGRFRIVTAAAILFALLTLLALAFLAFLLFGPWNPASH